MIDGVTSTVASYAERLNDGEFEVTVFCPTESKKYVDSFDYNVVRCKSFNCSFLDYRTPAPRLDRRFKATLEKSGLDIVHIHSPFAVGAMGVRYAKRHNIPAVATMHTQFRLDIMRATHSRLLTNFVMKRIMKVYNACDQCYAVNDAVADIYVDYGAKTRPGVLRNSTDFLPVPDIAAARAAVNNTYGLSDDTVVFLFVGRITKLKNIYFIADALKHLSDINYKMIVVGDGKDLPDYKKYVEQIGLRDRFVFTGKIADKEMLKALFCRAYLFLFPSLYDASSIVQIEAASQSLPTVFLEGAATAHGIIDGINGFLSRPTPDDYAMKIGEITENGALYGKVREGVFRDIYRHHDDSVQEIKDIYRTLVGQPR